MAMYGSSSLAAAAASSSSPYRPRPPIDQWSTAATGGAVQLPAFPTEWHNKPLNPADKDGEPDKAMMQTMEFLKKLRVRNLYMITDALVQFANRVSGMALRAGDPLASTSQTAADTLDRLIINYAVKTYRMHVLADNTGETSAEKEKRMKESNVTQSVIAEMLKNRLLASPALYSTSRTSQTPQTPEERVELERATKRQQEILLSSAFKQAAEKRKPTDAAAKTTGLAPSFALTPASVSPGVRVPVRTATSTVDPADMHGPPFPPQAAGTGYTITSAKAAAAAKVTPTDAEVDAVVNEKTMLTYMLLYGTVSDPGLRAVRHIFADEDLLYGDSERGRRDLEDLERLERLLRKTETGGSDILDIPQHTGWLVFSPEFTAAIASAMNVVHGVCRKTFAVEVDLMTHVTVTQPFARLVAYFLNGRTTSKATLLGAGGKAVTKSREDEYARLKDAFDKLTTVWTRDPVTGDPMQVLTFHGIHYGVQQNQAITESREQYMATTHRYYTDARQMRPFTLQNNSV